MIQFKLTVYVFNLYYLQKNQYRINPIGIKLFHNHLRPNKNVIRTKQNNIQKM